MAITVPVPQTWTDTDRFYADTMNARIRDPLYFLLFRRPLIRLYATSAIALTSGSFFTVQWSIEDVDNDNMFDPAFPHRIYCRTEGIYKGFYGSSWVTSNTTNAGNGRRILILRKNNVTATEHRADFTPRESPGTIQPLVIKGLPFFIRLSVGDWVEMWQYQDNAAAGAINTAVDLPFDQPELFMRWYSPL